MPFPWIPWVRLPLLEFRKFRLPCFDYIAIYVFGNGSQDGPVGKYWFSRFFLGIPTIHLQKMSWIVSWWPFASWKKAFLFPSTTGWLYLYSCEGQQLVKSGSLVENQSEYDYALPRNWVSLWITDSLRKYFVIKNSTHLRVRVFRCVCQHFRLGCCCYERKHTLNVGLSKFGGSGSAAISVLGCPVWFPWFEPWSCGVF